MGKNKISTQNYLGQQASSTDHNGTVLTFSYNAYGDLMKATSAGVDRISNVYDDYGRKTSMNDVDKGQMRWVSRGLVADFLKALAGDGGYSMESVSVNRDTYYAVMNQMWLAPKQIDYGLVNVNCVVVATAVWNTGPAPTGLYTNVTAPDVLRFGIWARSTGQ